MSFQSITIPDLWQRQAVQHLRAGRDVVVHAPTGAGKTYIFELFQSQLKGQAVFTVPTRALANDKLAEWRARGWDVGISTGDLAHRLDAKIIVATLETQRGRFLRHEGPRLLVVDEYQMIGDASRGVNYELALALAPPTTQLLLLSGSVGNPQDIVAWLRRIGREVELVTHDQRPVPLVEANLETLPQRAANTVRGHWPRLMTNALRAELGPVLLFAPRRAAAEALAQELASQVPCEDPLLLSFEQEMHAGPKLAKLLRARVAYHHSGLSYALRAGLIEPLAKNGQLRLVVATMGLAAGINFSMRSVVVTETRYTVGNFERQVEPDELVQMFGRAGRRGLDETGAVLYTTKSPRLLDARPRHLRRSTQLDWPTLIAVMNAAAQRGEPTFPAALDLNRRLFSPHDVPLGIEHALATGPMPCGLAVDMERARFARRPLVEMQNARGHWQPRPEMIDTTLSQAWTRDGEQWRPVLALASTVNTVTWGQLCRLPSPGQRRYGREVLLGTRKHGGLELAPWLYAQIGLRNLSPHGLETVVLPSLPALLEKSSVGKKAVNPSAHVPLSIGPLRAQLAGVITRGDQLWAQLDFGTTKIAAYPDESGRSLIHPETREAQPLPCMGCPEWDWCRTAAISVQPAWAWRKLGLIGPDGRPTRRGVIFSFFYHGEGLAIAAALEDSTYPVEDLVFDLANLRAGPRFAGDEAVYSGRLGALSQKVYDRADFPGYLVMGVPTDYGAGAAEVIRELVLHHTPRGKLLTDLLRLGDIERGLIEWRSLLRHVTLSPDYDWDRWRALKAEALRHVDDTTSPTQLNFPPLLPAQMRRG